jgi:DNA-binding transcriptional ArsR family regulator
VSFDDGTAAELLVSLAAMADPSWRTVFARAGSDRARARELGGKALVDRVASFGRFAYLNLLGPVTATDGVHSAAAAVDWVRRTPADEVKLTCLGARRRQLRDLVDDDRLRAAAAGDRRARAELKQVVTSGLTVLSVTPWLLATPAAEVKADLLGLLRTWRHGRLPPAAERELQAELTAEVERRRVQTGGLSARLVVPAVAGGLSYEPPSTPRDIVLVPAPSVAPIVVVVDDVNAHVIAYPPGPAPDARSTLLGLTRALGDDTRLHILEVLREAGPMTAGELTARLDAPRTSLLHHLAMLRAAGLLTTAVGPANSTRYALRPDAVGELASAARAVLDKTR